MQKITKKVVLDVSRGNIIKPVLAMQFDTNSRCINAMIADNGEAIAVETSASVVISAKRPDGTNQTFLGSVTSDGSVTLPLTNWMLAQKGKVLCNVSVIDSGGKMLTTTEFSIDVQENYYSSNGISQDSQNYDILLELLTSSSAAHALCEAATNSANAAASAANTAAENAASKAQLADLAATAATTATSKADAAAKSASSAASAANNAALAAKGAVSAANTAALAAEEAASAANQAALEADAAKQAAATAASNASTAAVSANNAASAANTAKQSADTAAASANTAASRANNAAAEAEISKQAATTAAARANAAAEAAEAIVQQNFDLAFTINDDDGGLDVKVLKEI